MADENGQASQADKETVSIKDWFDVHSDQPLNELDSPPALAYAASDPKDAARELFALVCDPKQPPRHEQVSTMHRVDQPGIIRVVDWKVIDWPLEERRCPVLIYERPRGKRVIDSIESSITVSSEDSIIQNFIKPVATALREIDHQNLTHRAIRPTNLFYDSVSVPQATIMLGECLASPPAMNQPAAYEPVESALASSSGRGLGTISDDLYAFGVSILAFLIGQSPGHGLSEEEINTAKLERGSYNALISGHRLSLTMLEVVRGLLMDDVEERWTLDDVDLWLAGRRLSPKQQEMPRATQPFAFGGQNILTGRNVAHALAKGWKTAIEPVRGGMLDEWLRRSLGNEEAIEAVNAAKEPIAGSVETDDRMLARIVLALDPQGPIRFKNFSATLDGIGYKIAAIGTDKDLVKNFTEILKADLISFACKMMGKAGESKNHFVTLYDQMIPFLAHSELGQGFERVIYELNPNLPCQSSLLESEYVYDMVEMLDAFERIATTNPEALVNPIDRHIAAFIVARMRGGIMTELRELQNRSDPAVLAIANIRILGHVQEQANSLVAPNLCKTAVKLLDPAIERFRSRRQRDQVRKRLSEISNDGRLADILRLVDNSKYLESDRAANDKAVKEFANSIQAMQRMEFEKTHRPELSKVIGAEIGAFFSLIFSMIALISMGVYWIIG